MAHCPALSQTQLGACVHACVHVYVCACVFTHARVCAYIHTYIHVCMSLFAYIRIHVWVHMHICACVYMCICVPVCIHMLQHRWKVRRQLERNIFLFSICEFLKLNSGCWTSTFTSLSHLLNPWIFIFLKSHFLGSRKKINRKKILTVVLGLAAILCWVFHFQFEYKFPPRAKTTLEGLLWQRYTVCDTSTHVQDLCPLTNTGVTFML